MIEPRRLVHELKPGATRSMLQTAAVCRADERAREAIWMKLLGTLGPVAGVGGLGIGAAVLGGTSSAAGSTALAPGAAASLPGVAAGSTFGVVAGPALAAPVLGTMAGAANTAVWMVALKSTLLSTVVSLASYSAFTVVAPSLLDPALATRARMTETTTARPQNFAPVAASSLSATVVDALPLEAPRAQLTSETEEVDVVGDVPLDLGNSAFRRPGDLGSVVRSTGANFGSAEDVGLTAQSGSGAVASGDAAGVAVEEVVLVEGPAEGLAADTSAVARFEEVPAPSVEPPPPAHEETDQELREEQRLVKNAGAALRAGRVPQALELLRTVQQRFPNGNLTQPREALLVEALVRSGHAEAARVRARRFVQLFPKSRLAARVQELAQLKDPLIYWPFWWNR